MAVRRKEPSVALELLELVWRNCASGLPHSWRLLNSSMQRALRLAIDAGLSFDLDDFREMTKRFRTGHWFGDTNGERFYAMAVDVGNLAAAKSFEVWKSRPPLIADEVHHPRGSSRRRDRVAVGSSFVYRGERVAVTSFVDGAVIACTYKSTDPYAKKVARRLHITAEDIKADRAEGKRRDEIVEAFQKAEMRDVRQFRKITGVKTEEEFRCCPLERLEKAFAEVMASEESS